MKIISLYYMHKPGGFCKRLYRLLNALVQRGNEVHFLSLEASFPGLSPEVHVHRIPFPLRARDGALFWSLFILWCPLVVAFWALRIKPSRYVVFNPFYAAMCILARMMCRAKLILFIRSLVFKINLITARPLIVRVISNMVDRIGIMCASTVIVQSASMERELAAFLGRVPFPSKQLPNDAPPASSTNQEQALMMPPPLHLFTSGVLDERKNIGLLLEALAIVQRDCGVSTVTLTVAGAGTLLEPLKASAQALALKGVNFLGWCDDILPHLKRAHLVVHPSLHEGSPNSILEALGAGIPVIGADIPEIRELLANEALLFPPRDAGKLAVILARIIANPGALATLNLMCSERARHFSFDWDEEACTVVLE